MQVTCAYIPPLSHYTRPLGNAGETKPEESLGGAQGSGFDFQEGGRL